MRICVLVSLTGLTVSAAAFAQDKDEGRGEYEPPEFISTPVVHPDSEGSEAVLSLDLKKALSIAAKNNLGIVLERESLKISELGVDVAGGAFEPRVTGSYRHTNSERLVESTVDGMPGETFTDKQHSWQVSLSKRFVTGTEVSLGFSNARVSSNSASSLPPFYGSVGQVTLRQPLLRGFSLDLDVPRLEVLRARLSTKSQRESARTTLMAVTERTESAYWGLVEALKSYQVQKSSLALAEAQMKLTEKQIRAGVLARADKIQAESTLAQRELQLITARRRIDAASDQLRAVLNLPRAEWKRPIVPTDSPEFEPIDFSAEAALELAIKNRPEARQAMLDVKRAEYDLRSANNNRLPQIDLDLSYSLSGQDERYRGALSEIRDRDAPEWSVAVSLVWTPLNRASGAAAKIARANKRIARAQREQAVLNIYTEVREAVRNLASAERELAAAARFRSLAERSLDAEQRKFRSGTSSNFLVAERSESVAQAQLAELGALVAHRLAGVGLQRATGQLLETRRIKLD